MSNIEDDFLDYFEGEISDLEEKFKDFGLQYPKAISSAKLAPRSSDPHINLLLESFAFYSAKIKSRVEELKYSVPEATLSRIDPALIEAIPAVSLAKYDINIENPPAPQGFNIPKNTKLYATSEDNFVCNFKSCYDLQLYPLNTSHLKSEPTHTRDFWGSDVRSVLTLQIDAFGCQINDINTTELRFFIDGETKLALKLREMLFRDLSEVVIFNEQTGDRVSLGQDCLRSIGYSDDEAILDTGLSANPSYRLLKEYCIFPQKFAFFSLYNLDFPAASNSLKILFGLKKSFPKWLTVDRLSFDLNVTPIINRYQKTAEPILLKNLKNNYRVRPELANEKSEIIRIEKVTLSSPGVEGAKDIPHVFASSSLDARQSIYWSSKHHKSFSSDVYASLVIYNKTPLEEDLDATIGLVDVICHNPKQAKYITPGTKLHCDFEIPGIVKVLNFPSKSHLRLQEEDVLWRLANRLRTTLPNFLKSEDKKDNARRLVEHLSDYVPPGLDTSINEIHGISELSVKPCIRKVHKNGHASLVEGFEVMVMFDSGNFAESNLYLFSEVLNEMMSDFVSLNSFVSLKTSTIQDPQEWLTWKPGRYGQSTI